MQSSREVILERVRQALQHKSKQHPDPADTEHSPYVWHESSLLETFAANITAKAANLFIVHSKVELATQLQAYLAEAQLDPIYAWEPQVKAFLTEAGVAFRDNDDNLSEIAASITLTEALVARTGSLVVSSRQKAGRRLTIYPPTHIVLAHAHQLQPDVADGLRFVSDKYGDAMPSMVSLTSGPSRTADIEKTLVLGAHGPKQLTVFILNDGEPEFLG